MKASPRVALVQLASFGDCLYVTLIAAQIKRDYLGCSLTWVISSQCSSILVGNPDVDEVHVVEMPQLGDAWGPGWRSAMNWVHRLKIAGQFDLIIAPQILPDNLHHWDGLIRRTLYRGYNGEVRGSHRPVLVLSQNEVEEVERFVESNNLRRFAHIFLFECGPRSGQSAMNPLRAEKLAHILANRFENAAFVMTSSLALQTPSAQVIDASSLSVRQNAELSHHCTGLIGCSSGITWITTSTAGVLLPMLQVVTGDTRPYAFASVAEDFRLHGLPVGHVIEMIDPSDDDLLSCIESWLVSSFELSRTRFHKPLRITTGHVEDMFAWILGKIGFADAVYTISGFWMRNDFAGFSILLVCKFLYRGGRMCLVRGLSKMGFAINVD